MDQYILAIDQGTSSSRAIIFNQHSKIIAVSQKEFPQHFPHPGWVEHDANEIWAAVTTVLTKLVSSLGQPVAAIGITDQRETVVAWSRRTGEPRHRAIVWQDRRTAARCDELRAEGH